MSEEFSRLEDIELREIWPTEDKHFTPWLAEEENLTQLGETLAMELELEAQEVPVGDFQADILCKNEDDSWVVIENQLEETNHKHLGQILTYASGLDAHTVIWIAKKFRDEHRAALDQLNEITDDRFSYFGVEIKVWKIGDSKPAPQFEIISKPNDWNRTVSRKTQRAVRNDLSEDRLLQEKFWEEFIEYLRVHESSLSPPSPKPQSYMTFRIGRSNFHIAASLSIRGRDIRIWLRMKKKDATAHFYLLKEQQEKIEKEFGEPLDWDELPDTESSKISLCKENTDPTDESDWPNQHEWFASKLELFDKVFRPRIKALNADDWEPLEDEDDE
ncbi:MAG: DUF4268 domain-containing protein [Candidatus Poribacteria bacterium]|nr:DUF4268 domain-containing protein [Candidatus Poribacteria bacterium]